MDQSLQSLVIKGVIDKETARRKADSPESIN